MTTRKKTSFNNIVSIKEISPHRITAAEKHQNKVERMRTINAANFDVEHYNNMRDNMNKVIPKHKYRKNIIEHIKTRDKVLDDIRKTRRIKSAHKAMAMPKAAAVRKASTHKRVPPTRRRYILDQLTNFWREFVPKSTVKRLHK